MIERVLSRKRIAVLLPSLAIVGAVLYTGWLVLQVRADFQQIERDTDELRAAASAADPAAARDALSSLQSATSSAHGRTDGAWWTALTHLPVVGDDAHGVARVAAVSDRLAREGVGPLLDAVELTDGITVDGGVDLDVVRGLEGPVARGARAFRAAESDLSVLEAGDFLPAVEGRYEEVEDEIGRLADSLESARRALDVVPSMAGAEGPRTYLLVFQNNAEIRATGGLPGAWSVIRADGGQLEMGRQGSAADFPALQRPVLPLSEAERRIYDEQLGTYFQDANFTPDFPRAAELMAARWEQSFGGRLDGVISLDTVTISYLLAGTGPVDVPGATLTPDNATSELLSNTYLQLEDPAAQDERFRAVSRAVFDAVTGALPSPLELVRGAARAAGEGRILVRSFEPVDQRALAGTRVAGELSAGDDDSPQVDISLNDATGAKMSYYLRYDVDVRAEGCSGDAQSLAGAVRMGSTISPSEVDSLPEYVSGGGRYGTDVGSQLVLLRIHGPVGGSVHRVRVDGRVVNQEPVVQDGRPVVTLVALLSPSRNVDITWQMRTGPGQWDDVDVGVTPSIEPGDLNHVAKSAC